MPCMCSSRASSSTCVSGSHSAQVGCAQRPHDVRLSAPPSTAGEGGGHEGVLCTQSARPPAWASAAAGLRGETCWQMQHRTETANRKHVAFTEPNEPMLTRQARQKRQSSEERRGSAPGHSAQGGGRRSPREQGSHSQGWSCGGAWAR